MARRKPKTASARQSSSSSRLVQYLRATNLRRGIYIPSSSSNAILSPARKRCLSDLTRSGERPLLGLDGTEEHASECNRDVQRIDTRLHRNRDEEICILPGEFTHAGALAADNEGRWTRVLLLPVVMATCGVQPVQPIAVLFESFHGICQIRYNSNWKIEYRPG